MQKVSAGLDTSNKGYTVLISNRKAKPAKVKPEKKCA